MKLNIQLFASGTITFAADGYLQGKIEWSSVSNGSVANTSTVTTTLYARRTNSYTTSGKQWKGNVKVGSNAAHSFGGFSSDTAISNSWKKFATYTDVVAHNNDGTKVVNISGWVNGPSGTSLADKRSSGNQNVTLDTIPRASEIDSINSGTTDFTLTLYFTPKSSDFKYLIKYQYGSYEKYSLMLSPGTTAQQAYAGITIYSSEIGPYMPNVTSGTLTATLYTYQADGTTYVGESSANFNINLNGNVLPSISIGNPIEADSIMQSLNWGIFVKTKSKLSYSVSASGVYGSSVSSITNSITGTTASGTTNVTTNYLTNAGTNTLTSKVTDSRGRSATATRTINVVDYFSPTIQTFQVQRCDINGNLTDEGEYLYYNLAGRVASCSNHNTGTYKLRYKETGASTWSNWIILGTGIEWTGNGILQSGETKVFFDDIKIYDIDFAVQDTFSTNSSQSELNSVADLMNWNPAGTSMAIGKVSQRTASEKVLDIALDTNIDKNLNVDKEVVVGQIKSKNLFNKNISPIANNGTIISILDTGLRATTTSPDLFKWSTIELDNSLLGKTLTISSIITPSGNNHPSLGLWFGNSINVAISKIGSLDETGSVTLNIPSTFPAECDKLFLFVYSNSDGSANVGDYIDYNNLMIEEGSTATEYYPHQNLNGEEIYSTNEIIIGTWIDGKKIYRKVVTSTNLPSNIENKIPHGISNLNAVINISGYYKAGGLNLYYPVCYIGATISNDYKIYTNVYNNDISSYCGVYNTGNTYYDAYIVLEYTKTTD